MEQNRIWDFWRNALVSAAGLAGFFLVSSVCMPLVRSETGLRVTCLLLAFLGGGILLAVGRLCTRPLRSTGLQFLSVLAGCGIYFALVIICMLLPFALGELSVYGLLYLAGAVDWVRIEAETSEELAGALYLSTGLVGVLLPVVFLMIGALRKRRTIK